MAKSVISHLQEKKDLEGKLTSDGILSNILYYRIHSYIEQISIINVLPSFIQQNPEIKLIVLDSVAFHFRMGFDDMSFRSRILSGMSKNLSSLASQFDIAIVVM